MEFLRASERESSKEPHPMSSDYNYSDMQGLVRFGYRKAEGSQRYALAKIKNVEAARYWLLSAPITSAVKIKAPPSTALQVACTGGRPRRALARTN